MCGKREVSKSVNSNVGENDIEEEKDRSPNDSSYVDFED
jgi:hypothetical protein